MSANLGRHRPSSHDNAAGVWKHRKLALRAANRLPNGQDAVEISGDSARAFGFGLAFSIIHGFQEGVFLEFRALIGNQSPRDAV